MEFSRETKRTRFKLTNCSVYKNRTKDAERVTIVVNDIKFTTASPYTDEDLVYKSFFEGEKILCTKLFENTAWGDSEEIKMYSIILLEDTWVEIALY